MPLAYPEKENLAIVIAVRHDSRGANLSRINRARCLQSCLFSLIASIAWNRDRSMIRWKNIQIVLVDDKSPVSVGKFLDDLKSNILILENKGTPGQAGALNYALATISADVYAFTDSDCIVAHNWVSVLAEHYTRFPMHIGTVGPNWLFIEPVNCWRSFLTRQEGLLTRFIFKSYVDFEQNIAWRIDCRNFSLRNDFLDRYFANRSFFVEGKGPSVSAQTTYIIKDVLTAHELVIGFEPRLLTYHQPVENLWSQVVAYYHRGRHGDFNQLYSRESQGLARAFLKRYLIRHFVIPSIYDNVFWPYLFLVHSAYWVGILYRHFTSF